ncbi:hypothetical protein K8T06_00645 [bacterium]|nr:hypothetical protein [bacterium]
MNQNSQNLLFWLPIMPMIGGILLSIIPAKSHRYSGFIAIAVTILIICITLSFEPITLPWHVNPSVDSISTSKIWIPDYHINFRLSLDGFSGWMIILTSLATLTSLIFSFFTDQGRDRYFSIMIILASAIGIFLARDMFTLLFAWGIWLVIPFCTSTRQKNQKRPPGYLKFFAFHLFSLLLVTAGMAMVYLSEFKGTGTQNFEISAIAKLSIPLDIQQWLLLFLFTGFAIRMPLFPFHGWLSDSLDELPPCISALLTATGMATGSYALIHFCLPLCPDLIIELNRYFIFAAMVSMVYGAFVALVNPHLLQRLGFACIGYSGFLLMGIFSLNKTGLAGTALVSANFIITSLTLILASGWISLQADSVLLQDMGGIWKKSPLITGIYLIASLAFVGVPGLCLFPGIFLVIGGTLLTQPAWAAIVIAAFLVLATGMLWMFQQIFTGKSTSNIEKFEYSSDITPGRILIPITALMIWFGFFPQYMIRSMKTPIEAISQHIQSHRIFKHTSPEISPLELFFQSDRTQTPK